MAKMAVGSWAREGDLLFGSTEKLLKRAGNIIGTGEKGMEKKRKADAVADHRNEVKNGKRKALNQNMIILSDDEDEDL
jgi:uncharacterized protein YycO